MVLWDMELGKMGKELNGPIMLRISFRNRVGALEPVITSVKRRAKKSERGILGKTAPENSEGRMFSQAVPDTKANGSVPCEMAKAFKPGQAELDTKASGRTIRLTGWANFGTYSEQLKTTSLVTIKPSKNDQLLNQNNSYI